MKTSNKILLAAMVLILVILTVSVALVKVNVLGNVISGDGDVRQENRSAETFDMIDVEGNFKVYYTQEGPAQIMVTADNNLLEYILTEVVDGELQIKTMDRLRSDQLRLDISCLDIKQIKTSAGARLFGENAISTPELTLHSSSGSRIELEAIVEQLIVSLSSGSHVNLKGEASSAEYSASAGSQLEAFDMESQKVSASGSSGSRLNVNATDELSVKGSSGSSIYYEGTPVINELNLSSGAAIHQRSR